MAFRSSPWLSRSFIGDRPGDYIFWKGDEERSKAIGVVQSVSAEERIANVRWESDNETEQVPLLELDPHGLGFTEATGGPETFGIRRGEFVLIHREGTTNSATLPIVPRIGEMEAWVGESLPIYTEDAQPTGWRSNMAKFGMDVLATGTARQPLPRPDGAPRVEIRWFGQVLEVSSTLPSRLGFYPPLHSSISMEVFKLFYHMMKSS
jgi:ubiquitin-conjugating enzyme E2 O